MYGEYEGGIDFILAIKGAIAIIAIWAIVAIAGNFLQSIKWKIKKKKK